MEKNLRRCIIRYLIIINLITIIKNDYSIQLKMKGKGNQKIYNKPCPDEIYINNEKGNNNQKQNLDYDYNNIILLKYRSRLTDCSAMFQGCESITEIDFLNFDTSEVRDMNSMFDGCRKLTSINFRNFDTSKVTYMHYMFTGCERLASINFTNFDTSSLENSQQMFFGCRSLTFLDLSNFDTSKVTYMVNMFGDCSSLKYLNLKNFNNNKLSSSNSISNIFNGINNDLIICYNIK